MDVSYGGKANPWKSKRKEKMSREFIESNKPIITLYHAVWCVHCKDFIPKWEE